MSAHTRARARARTHTRTHIQSEIHYHGKTARVVKSYLFGAYTPTNLVTKQPVDQLNNKLNQPVLYSSVNQQVARCPHLRLTILWTERDKEKKGGGGGGRKRRDRHVRGKLFTAYVSASQPTNPPAKTLTSYPPSQPASSEVKRETTNLTGEVPASSCP